MLKGAINTCRRYLGIAKAVPAALDGYAGDLRAARDGGLRQPRPARRGAVRRPRSDACQRAGCCSHEVSLTGRGGASTVEIIGFGTAPANEPPGTDCRQSSWWGPPPNPAPEPPGTCRGWLEAARWRTAPGSAPGPGARPAPPPAQPRRQPGGRASSSRRRAPTYLTLVVVVE
jgi:hypothetical protein